MCRLVATSGKIAMTHGLITETGFECCVFCWEPFAMQDDRSNPNHPGIGMGVNYTEGNYCHAQTGERYEYLDEHNAGEPIAHPECYKEWKAQTRPNDEAELTEWTE